MAKQMNPNSLRNLIPNSKRTKEQLQEMGRKGGTATSKIRRERWEVNLYVRFDVPGHGFGKFEVLAAYPGEATEEIRKAVHVATTTLEDELKKAYCKMYKRRFGRNPTRQHLKDLEKG